MRFGYSLMLLLSAMLTASIRAQDGQPTEYQLKAAFIFNFAKFVEWPSGALPNASAPVIIGILGDDPFGNDLEQTIKNKAINEHPLRLEKIHSAAEATNCHVLFISSSEKSRLPDILKGLRGTSVLTVSETDGFTEAGGMINFVKEGKKVRFQINDPAARQSNLKVSSKLLNLAVPSNR
jgi:hypothetical protein